MGREAIQRRFIVQTHIFHDPNQFIEKPYLFVALRRLALQCSGLVPLLDRITAELTDQQCIAFYAALQHVDIPEQIPAETMVRAKKNKSKLLDEFKHIDKSIAKKMEMRIAFLDGPRAVREAVRLRLCIVLRLFRLSCTC